MTVTKLVAATLVALTSASAAARIDRSVNQPAAGPRIEITIAREARAETTTGMVYVAISRDIKRTPIEQASPTGSPLFLDCGQQPPVRHAGRAHRGRVRATRSRA